MLIKKLTMSEITQALPLIWSVFTEFEASSYPKVSQNAFWEAIHSKEYLESLSAYGAFENNQLIGILATRNEGEHIALFFVDGSYQKKGIGRKLWNTFLSETNVFSVSVHSSLYAVKIYEKLGFIRTNSTQFQDGLKYIPMNYIRHE